MLVTVEKKRKGGGEVGVKVASNELTCERWSVGKWTWEISTHLSAASNTLHWHQIKYYNIYIKKKVELNRI